MINVPFPLIIPVDEENKIYKGYIPIQNKEYYLQVQLGPKGKIFGSKELNELIAKRHDVITTKLQQANDIMNFLTEFKETLETTASNTLTTNKAYNYSFKRYSSIYNELSKIGFDRIDSMSDTMQEIIFKSRDKSNRIHLLRMQISIDYPFVPPQVTCQLPTSISTTANTTISNLLTQHEQLVNQYQELFDCLDDIDSNMRIIEPDKPTRTDLYRRIALGHHCSFQIEFNPNYAPKKDGKPKNIRFFGNLNRVQELKNKWKLYEWKLYEKMHVNLLNSFQIVTTTTEADEDYTNTDDIECGICYSFKLDNGELPEIICVNSLCNRGFHSICLYEWLRSNPSTTSSFNILFGKCPYCNEKITIKAII